MRARLELLPIAAGAIVGVPVLAAAGSLAQATDAAESSGRTWLLVALMLLAVGGLAAAGWIAARRCRRAPLSHAAAAALTVAVAAEVVAVARVWVAGDDIRFGAAAGWLLLALAAGVGGGLTALRPPPKADSVG